METQRRSRRRTRPDGTAATPAAACSTREADHLVPWSKRGPTDIANGGPKCDHHNRNSHLRGVTTIRDAEGLWRTYRADGTEVGWRILVTDLEHLPTAIQFALAS